MFWTVLFSIFVLAWLTASLLMHRFAKRAFKKYRSFPLDLQATIDPKYKGVLRQDFGKWDEQKMLRNCWLFFPLHLFAMCGFLTGFGLLATIQRYLWLPDIVVDTYRYYFGRIAFKICFDLKENFSPRDKLTAPLVISNHTSWSDIIYMGGCIQKTSFVSNADVKKIPVISSIASYLQTIYVDRENKENRGAVKEQIVARNEQFKKDPDAHYPISIYPEGTIGNGRSVLHFKNGAFQSLSPATLMSLRYSCKEFHCPLDHITMGENFLFLLCVRPKVEVSKYNIAPEPSDTVETYRERCRAKLGEMLGFPLVDCDYKDVMKYYKMLQAEHKERLKKPSRADSSSPNATQSTVESS